MRAAGASPTLQRVLVSDGLGANVKRRLSVSSVDWREYFELCDAIGGLSRLEREQGRRSLQLLKTVFGEDFIAYAIRSNHPIVKFIDAKTKYDTRWLIWFARCLEEAQKWPGMEGLLERLRNARSYHDSSTVLDVGCRLQSSGFEVSVDPIVSVAGNPKKPDIKLLDNQSGDTLYVEVSSAMQSTVASEALNAFDLICEPLKDTQLLLSGRLCKILSVQHAKEVAGRIRTLVREVQETNRFHELNIEEVEIGLAPLQDQDTLVNWARSHRLTMGGFESPDLLQADEITRTNRMIREEQKQVPLNHPAMLVIENNYLFLKIQDPRRIFAGLEETVYRYPHLIGVMVIGSEPGRGSKRFSVKTSHIYARKTSRSGFTEHSAMLFNKFCKAKVSGSTMSRLITSLKI